MDSMLRSARMQRTSTYRPLSRPLAPRLVTLRLTAAVLVLAALALGCKPAAETAEVDKAEIQTMLEEYLPRVGAAYKERNPSLLGDLAVPKEKARIELRVDELTDKGQIYEPEFKSVTVESISVWNHSNAYATTLEVWDVSSYTIGSHVLITQVLDQRSRVKYQLKLKDEGWVVLYRELETTLDS